MPLSDTFAGSDDQRRLPAAPPRTIAACLIFKVVFVIFPGITRLDFTSPFEVLSGLGTPPSISAPSKNLDILAKDLWTGGTLRSDSEGKAAVNDCIDKPVPNASAPVEARLGVAANR